MMSKHGIGGSPPSNFMVSAGVSAPTSIVHVVTERIVTKRSDELHFFFKGLMAFSKIEENHFPEILFSEFFYVQDQSHPRPKVFVVRAVGLVHSDIELLA
jgi:hypothetical protein